MIATFRTLGMGPTRIGAALNRDPSSISRELKRNTVSGEQYDGETAHSIAENRQSKRSSRPWKLTREMAQTIRQRLGWQHAPDAIAGRCRRDGEPMVSGTWIYELVYRDRQDGGELWRLLLRKHRTRKKRPGRRDSRGQIPGRRMIDERPAHVARRDEVGHWEGDSVMGKGNRTRLVTLIERQSRLTRIVRPVDRSAEATTQAIVKALAGETVATLTVDNGKEFSGHADIARSLGIDVYFATPYAPWQRASSENVNGIVRRHLPKGTDFSTVTDLELAQLAHRIDNTPRKVLGYATAWEVYSGQANPPPPVAL